MSELTIRMTNDDDQVSKSNQIDMLEELQKFFEGHDLYLSSFFRIELVDWAIQAIENDIAPDIWADRVFRISEHYEVAQKLHNLRAANEMLEDQIKTGYDNTGAAFVERDEKISGMHDTIEMLEHTNESLRGDLQMAREMLGSLEQQLRVSAIEVSTLQLTVIELKSKLWDTFAEGMP